MITFDFIWVLSVVGASLCAITAGVALFVARSNQRWHRRCVAVEASLESVRREMEMVASISVRTGRRLKRVENEYSGVVDRVDLVELRGPAQAFERAIDSARQGVDPGKLSQQFGLSRGEAELVARLHGCRKTA